VVFERRALDVKEEAAGKELRQLAERLTVMRVDGADRIATQVNAILPDLGLAGGRFEAKLLPMPEITGTGTESVEFRVSLNAGFEPRPLARVASGGELSRVMLALKTILARLDEVPTLVFDEVDAGIGGQVGHRLGEKLRDVSRFHQVFVVTHLPQIACRAASHLRVSKSADEGPASTLIIELDGEERIRELVRMLGGDRDSAPSREHAIELLRTTLRA